MPSGVSALIARSEGTVSDGGVRSATVTENDAVAVFEWASVAWHVTVVVPSGNVVPDAGAQVTSSGPSTASFAVGGV